MKNTLRCPKCGHNHILYVAHVADGAGTREVPAPMKVAFTGPRGKFLGLPYYTLDSAAGDLEAGICKRCGYTEFYTKNPESIPIDGTYVREIIGPEE